MDALPPVPAGWDFSNPWYHGSPHCLKVLLAGSTITQDRDLARVFSHKPPIVSITDDPLELAAGVPRLQHNGEQPGLLYVIDEPLSPVDVYPHPRTTMPPGLEWLTFRPLRLRLVGPVSVRPAEYLTPQAIEELIRSHSS